MELKSTSTTIEEAGRCRFNRTFMELKYISEDLKTFTNWFQSYLYGIEIRVSSDGGGEIITFQSYLYGIEIQNMVWDVTHEYSFNRTFMELKCFFANWHVTIITFQSYLYGIEILCKTPTPLVLFTFQSYLYGIEIGWKQRKGDGLISFNRTFMELKSDSGVFAYMVLAFQSYLYGIEIWSKTE